jgi:hypothetical protein
MLIFAIRSQQHILPSQTLIGLATIHHLLSQPSGSTLTLHISPRLPAHCFYVPLHIWTMNYCTRRLLILVSESHHIYLLVHFTYCIGSGKSDLHLIARAL